MISARTKKNIATLDPLAQARFRAFAEEAGEIAASLGCEYVMICGHRTWAEQDRLFAKGGVTKARGGYSNHNFGIAGDFGVFQGKVYLDGSKPKLASKVHRACSAVAGKHSLAWGGAWKTFRDEPHYELITPLTMAQKRQVYAKHGSVLA